MLALAACTGSTDTPLPDSTDPPTARPTTSEPTAGPPLKPGQLRLTRGSVQLVADATDANRRDVLEAYLAFFAAYADALAKAEPQHADLRRRTSPAAFTGFSRSIAENARDGLTLRGPLRLRPRLSRQALGTTTLVVDCVDATGQRFYDRSGKPGEAGDRRAVQVELVQTPTAVHFIVGSLADGPAAACEGSS